MLSLSSEDSIFRRWQSQDKWHCSSEDVHENKSKSCISILEIGRYWLISQWNPGIFLAGVIIWGCLSTWVSWKHCFWKGDLHCLRNLTLYCIKLLYTKMKCKYMCHVSFIYYVRCFCSKLVWKFASMLEYMCLNSMLENETYDKEKALQGDWQCDIITR